MVMDLVFPDVMVDTNDDLLDDTSVFFGRNNKLKVRLRNRGNASASSIQVDFWYQKATPFLTSAGWIPVQNLAGTTQRLSGITMASGAEQWFSVDWCPVDDGTHHGHWCVKVKVSCPTDPNNDNKMAFRNFANVVAGGPDPVFSSLVRYVYWTERDRLFVVPRGPDWSMKLQNPGAFVNSDIAASDDYGCGSNHMVFGVPLDLRYATFSSRGQNSKNGMTNPRVSPTNPTCIMVLTKEPATWRKPQGDCNPGTHKGRNGDRGHII